MATVPNPACPPSWFSCDIRLGSLTLHLDEDNWNKAAVAGDEYDRVTQVFSGLAGSPLPLPAA